jgi:hypothetical protein
MDGQKGARKASETTRKRVEQGIANLAEYVVEMERWPTPTSRDWKDGRSIGQAPVNALLCRAVGPTPENGSLNPEWVEWLMGFPSGWTDLKD